MPFLAAAIPAIMAIGGAVSAGAGVAKMGIDEVNAANARSDREKQQKAAQEQAMKAAGDYKFGNEGDKFYQMGMDAQNRSVDPYAKLAQQQLVTQLQNAAAGKGPSAAQGQLQAGTDEAIKTAMALSGSARGANTGGQQIAALNSGTMATQQGANQAAILRAQEQQAAYGQLGTVLGGMRTADTQDAARKDELERFYMSLGQTRENAALNARIAMNEEKGRGVRGAAALNEQGREYDQSRSDKFSTGLINAGGDLLTRSGVLPKTPPPPGGKV